MSKVVKGIGRAVKKVVSGIGRAVKRVVKSPLGKVALTVAGAYFAAPIFGKALGAIGQGISGAANLGRGLIGGMMGDGAAAEAVSGAAAGDWVQSATGAYELADSGGSGGGLISSLWKGMNTPAGTTLMRLAGGLLTQNETAMQINARDRWQREAIERASANQNVGAIRLPGVYAPPTPQPMPQPAALPVNAPPPTPGVQTAQAPLPGMPVQPVAPDPNVPQSRPWQQPGLIGGAMYA